MRQADGDFLEEIVRMLAIVQRLVVPRFARFETTTDNGDDCILIGSCSGAACSSSEFDGDVSALGISRGTATIASVTLTKQRSNAAFHREAELAMEDAAKDFPHAMHHRIFTSRSHGGPARRAPHAVLA